MAAIANIFKIPELRKRIFFTIGMLAVYRIGIFVTTPGVDRSVMREIVAGSAGGFLNLFNVFAGGALEQLSIFALGIMPYVSASIIIQLLSVVVKPLEELRKEGEAGQRKINQYTRYGAVVLSAVQGFGIALYLESLRGPNGADVVHDPGWSFRLMTILSLTTGTAFLMWLGEQIGERGIGNGISLIIFAGIVVGITPAVFQTIEQLRDDTLEPVQMLVVTVICLAVVAVVTFFERGQYRLPVQYAKRQVGRKMYGGQSSHLPLKVNQSGVIPPIFASTLLMFPFTLQQWGLPYVENVTEWLTPGNWLYQALYATMIIFFAYFYTAVVFQPVEVAENLKKQNANIPGVRPGKATQEHIDYIMSRITFAGACYMAVVCTIPDLLMSKWHVMFYFGGTSIMIVVGVALDTVQQIESYLITRHYEGITGPGGTRIRGRKG